MEYSYATYDQCYHEQVPFMEPAQIPLIITDDKQYPQQLLLYPQCDVYQTNFEKLPGQSDAIHAQLGDTQRSMAYHEVLPPVDYLESTKIIEPASTVRTKQLDIPAKSSRRSSESEVSPFMLYYKSDVAPAQFRERRKQLLHKTSSPAEAPKIMPRRSKRQNACCGGGAYDYKITSNVYYEQLKGHGQSKDSPDLRYSTMSSWVGSDDDDDDTKFKPVDDMPHTARMFSTNSRQASLGVEMLPSDTQIGPKWTYTSDPSHSRFQQDHVIEPVYQHVVPTYQYEHHPDYAASGTSMQQYQQMEYYQNTPYGHQQSMKHVQIMRSAIQPAIPSCKTSKCSHSMHPQAASIKCSSFLTESSHLKKKIVPTVYVNKLSLGTHHTTTIIPASIPKKKRVYVTPLLEREPLSISSVIIKDIKGEREPISKSYIVRPNVAVLPITKHFQIVNPDWLKKYTFFSRDKHSQSTEIVIAYPKPVQCVA